MTSMEISMTGAGPSLSSTEDKQDLYNDLINTVKACSERGMYNSAKW